MRLLLLAVIVVIAILVVAAILRGLDQAIRRHKHDRWLREAKWEPRTLNVGPRDVVQIVKYNETPIEIGEIDRREIPPSERHHKLLLLEDDAVEEAALRNELFQPRLMR